MNNNLNNSKKTLERYQNEIDGLKSDNNSKDKEIKKMNLNNKNKGEEKEKELKNLLKENNELKKNNLIIKKELENEKKSKEELNKENEFLRTNEKKLKDKIKENENKQRILADKEKELNNHKLDLEKQLNIIKKNNKEIENGNIILEDENKKVRLEKDDLNKRNLELEKKSDKLKRDYLEINKLLKNKDKELENKDIIINQYNKEKAEFVYTKKKMKDNIKKIKSDIKEKEEKIKQIEGELKVKEKELKELQNNKSILDKNIYDSNKSHAELEKINIELNQKIKNIDNKLQKLKYEKEGNEKQNKNKDLLGKSNKLNDDNSNHIEEIRVQKARNEELSQLIKKKEEEYNNKIKEYENKGKKNDDTLKRREMELNERESELIIKEKKYNDKIELLKYKKDLIIKEKNEMKLEKEKFQKDKEEYKKIEKEIFELIKQNGDLKKEINTKNNIFIKNLGNNNFNNNNNLNNNIYNNTFNKKNDIFDTYKTPTLIGLNNIGASCFMNSALQCLSQTKPLTKYFLNKQNKESIINKDHDLKKKSDTQLYPKYLELIIKLWEKDGPKSFSPYSFINTIEKMNPLFKQRQAGDSKDFIIFILEQLHKELKKPTSFKDNNQNQSLNQYNRQNAQNYIFSDFKKEGSIISDHFFGFTETINECLYCKQNYVSKGCPASICYNYELFNCLIFPLEKVKTMKNNNNQMNSNNIIITIYECFKYNQNTKLFTYCNICKHNGYSNYTSKIFVSPNILILILDRERGNVFNVKLDFYEIIDITQFVLIKDKPQLIYDLYGVISYIGESGPNAQFVASCKSPIDNKWYRYNDAFVNPINDLKEEVIDFATPYILFYQKV